MLLKKILWVFLIVAIIILEIPIFLENIMFSPIPPYLGSGTPAPNTTPMTFGQSVSILQRVERVVFKLNAVIAFVNEHINNLDDVFLAQINTLITSVNGSLTELDASVDTRIATLDSSVDSRITASEAGVDSAIAALTTYVDTQVASILDSSIDIAAGVVLSLVNDPTSTVTLALRNLYAAKSVETLTTSGRLTVSALDAAYITTNAQVATIVSGAGATKTALDSAYLVTNSQVAAIVVAAGVTKTALDAAYITTNAQVAAIVSGAGATKTALDLAYSRSNVNLSGTYVARPVATTVSDGTLYFCTNVPEVYRSNGTVWSVVGSGGNELAYAENTASFAVSTINTITDITGLTITFVAGERPVLIKGESLVSNSAAGSTVLGIYANGANRTSAAYTGAAGSTTLHSEFRLTGLTAGNTYTAKLTGRINYTGTGTYGGNTVSGAPTQSSIAFIQAVTI
jgi:hypothetical protein